MKRILIPLLLLGLVACSTTQSLNGNEEIKQYSPIEQQRCPSAWYHSVHKRLECKYRVREELNQQKSRRVATLTFPTTKRAVWFPSPFNQWAKMTTPS